MEAKKKKILVNTFYTIAGALVLNGVLQLLVYPKLNTEMGTEGYGRILYVMAFVNILGPSVGQALNNSRLVLRRDFAVRNGDYDRILLLFSAIGIAVSLPMASGSISGAGGMILAAVLILLTVFRYYGDVEYRLSLNYRNYFFYYSLCGIGYAAGYVLYRITGVWYLIFLTGEAASLIFVAVTGSVFHAFFRRSDYFRTALEKGAVLVLSYFITNLTLNIDRIFLQNALGSRAVSIYYVVSLIGKTLVLFIAPVNTIIISYLTREKKKMDRKHFLIFSGAGLLAGALFFLLCEVATPIFIRLFYPTLLSDSRGLVTVVNLTQILAMLSAYLFIIVLTFTSERWQLGLQAAHLGVLLILITVMTPGGGLFGFSAAVLIANTLRVLVVLILGIIKSGKNGTVPKKKEEHHGETNR